MIATVFFVLVFGVFTCWVTWQWGIWVGMLTWVSLAWGMLINFAVGVEGGRRKTHERTVERMEEMKQAIKEGEERVH